MKIKVIGKGHYEGKSKKTGNDYNFNAVCYLGKERGIEGLTGQRLTLEPSEYPLSMFVIGAEYNVELDARGYCVGIEPVKS